MIGYFRTGSEMQQWAAAQAEQARVEFERTGSTVSLGYALAMSDVAASVVDSRVDVPRLLRM